MVLVVYKKTQKNAFAIECPLQTTIATLLTRLIQINNIRVYLDRLIWSVQQLANKGVLKPSELQGVSWEDLDKNHNIRKFGTKPIVQPPYRYVSDKHNQRYGIILPENQRQILLDAISKAKNMLEFKSISVKIEDLCDSVQGLRDAVLQTYPGYLQLPEWQPTLLMLQEKVQLQILQTESMEVFDERATVWWTGKLLKKKKSLSAYVGRNQKTKIIVKVQKYGGQQPLRQPPIDAETYQKMVKYYYRKVEETKQMETKSVQAHYDKVQANLMKTKVHLGEEQIRYKPF